MEGGCIPNLLMLDDGFGVGGGFRGWMVAVV